MSRPTWILDDGRPGHHSQARALAARLGGAVSSVTCAARPPWGWLAPRVLPASAGTIVPAVDTLEPPAVVIGAGRRAALANRLLKRRFGAGVATVQILDPRVDPRHFDVVLVPAHDRRAGANTIRFEGSLHRVDADWLAAARADWPALGGLPRPRTVLLLAGSGRRRARALLRAASRALERDGGSLLLATAPRTPAATSAWLCRAAPPEAVIHLHGERGAPYPGYLAWGDRFLLDGDSVNMLSEALATARPVAVPDWRVGGGAGRFVKRCRRAGWVSTPEAVPRKPAQRPFPGGETARVARELSRRLRRGPSPAR